MLLLGILYVQVVVVSLWGHYDESVWGKKSSILVAGICPVRACGGARDVPSLVIASSQHSLLNAVYIWVHYLNGVPTNNK